MTVIPESQTEGKAPQAATQILDKLDTDLAIDAGDTQAAILAADALVNEGVVAADIVESSTINDILELTQAVYDALGPPDANTLYLIIG